MPSGRAIPFTCPSHERRGMPGPGDVGWQWQWRAPGWSRPASPTGGLLEIWGPPRGRDKGAPAGGRRPQGCAGPDAATGPAPSAQPPAGR